MEASNDVNAEVVEKLTAQINNVFEAADRTKNLTPGEIILTLLTMLGELLANIDCAGCRRQTRKEIERLLPQFLREAMIQAAQNPQVSDHVH